MHGNANGASGRRARGRAVRGDPRPDAKARRQADGRHHTDVRAHCRPTEPCEGERPPMLAAGWLSAERSGADNHTRNNKSLIAQALGVFRALVQNTKTKS